MTTSPSRKNRQARPTLPERVVRRWGFPPEAIVSGQWRYSFQDMLNDLERDVFRLVMNTEFLADIKARDEEKILFFWNYSVHLVIFQAVPNGETHLLDIFPNLSPETFRFFAGNLAHYFPVFHAIKGKFFNDHGGERLPESEMSDKLKSFLQEGIRAKDTLMRADAGLNATAEKI